MNVGTIVGSIVMVLLIPFVLSVITKIITANKKEFQDFISEQCDNLQLLFLCLAVATFPDKPLISLALVIGPLIELPVLSIVSAILLRWNKD